MAKSFSRPRVLPKRGGLRLSDQQRKAATIWYNWFAGGGGQPSLLQTLIAQSTADILQLQFNGAAVITTDGWGINTDGPNALSISSVSGSGTSTPSFTLSREILPGEIITISYSGGITTVGGKDLGDITDKAVTNSVRYWADDFAGTSPDTTRFTVTNPDAENLTISQNNAKIFFRTTDVNIDNAINNNVKTNLLFTRGVFSVLIDKVTGFSASAPVFRYWVDSNNFISIQGSPQNIRVAIQEGGSSLEYDVTTSISIDNIRVRIKFDTSNQILFEYWNGTAWEILPTTSQQTINVGLAGQMHISTNSSASDAPNDYCEFRQLRFAPSAWDTEMPEDFFFNDITMGSVETMWGDELTTFI